MKKLNLKISVMFLFFLGGILSMNAQTVTSTFYGAKASNNANNPCKGATIRKCGVLETSLTKLSSLPTLQQFIYQEKSRLYGAEGQLISETTNEIKIPAAVDAGTFLIDRNTKLYPNAVIELVPAKLEPGHFERE